MKPTTEFWRLLGIAIIIAASGWALGQSGGCRIKFSDPQSEASP